MEYSGTQPERDPRTTNLSAIVFRGMGAIVLATGLYLAFTVVERAWELFDNQDRVVRLGESIEKNSNLNSWTAQLNANVIFEIVRQMKPYASSVFTGSEPAGMSAGSAVPASAAPPAQPRPSLNASYFVAWFLTIILLSLVGRISFWMITSGGQLAASSMDQNKQLKSVLRELIAEVRRTTPRVSSEPVKPQ